MVSRHGILVGVDGSASAANALRWAESEGLRRSEPVTAMLAWSYLDQHDPDRPGVFNPKYEETDAQAALETFVANAVGPDHDLHLKVVCDRPVPALVNAAPHYQLLVVGSRGAGGFAGLALGSTSEGVIARAGRPVVVVRGPAGTGPVVAELEEDDHPDDVARAAVEAATIRDGRLVVLGVYDRPPFAGWVFEDDTPFFDRLARRRQTLLEETMARIDTTGLDVEIRVLGGSPSGSLVDLAIEQDASLVVIGDGIMHQLVRHAPGPVLLV